MPHDVVQVARVRPVRADLRLAVAAVGGGVDAVGSAGGVVMGENVALQLYGGDASGDFGNYRNAPDAMSHVPTDFGRPGRGRCFAADFGRGAASPVCA